MACGPLLRLAWYLLVFALPFTDILFFPEQMRNAGQPSTFLVGLAWVAVLMQPAAFRGSPARADGASRPLQCFVAVAALSTLMSYALPVSEFIGNVAWEKSLRQLAHLGIFLSVFLLAGMVVRSREELYRTLRVFAASVGVVLLCGVLELGVAYLHLSALEPVLEVFHWGSWYKVPGDSAVLQAETPMGVVPRLRLVFAEPSMAGPFLAIAFVLLVGEALRRSRHRWWWGMMAGISVVLLLLSLSAGGLLVLLASAALLLTLLPGKRTRLHYAAGLVCLALLFAILPSLVEFTSISLLRPWTDDLSSKVRLESVEAGLRMSADYPFLGVGFGNSPFYIYDYLTWRPEVRDFLGWYIGHGEFALPVLNLFIRMLAETGVAGGFLFAWWHFRILRHTWKTSRTTQDVEQRILGTVLFVACVAVVLGYFVESGFDKRYWAFALGVSVAWVRLAPLRESLGAAPVQPRSPARSHRGRWRTDSGLGGAACE
jgi:hypothetical protein